VAQALGLSLPRFATLAVRNECNNCRFWARAAEVKDDFMALELVQLAQVQLSAQLDGASNGVLAQSPC
jgi:hypothetical protein